MDVLGLRVAEARRRLAQAGVTEVREERTAPPRGGAEGALRVVRVRTSPPGAALVVASFPELHA